MCEVENFFTHETIEDKLDVLIENGPSWIHANLVIGKQNTSVVVLEFGECVGNPNPTINVSYEESEIVLER